MAFPGGSLVFPVIPFGFPWVFPGFSQGFPLVFPGSSLVSMVFQVFPQTVLALWGSGVFKGWLTRGARARFPDTQNHKKTTVFKLFQKQWCWGSSFEVHLFIF